MPRHPPPGRPSTAGSASKLPPLPLPLPPTAHLLRRNALLTHQLHSSSFGDLDLASQPPLPSSLPNSFAPAVVGTRPRRNSAKSAGSTVPQSKAHVGKTKSHGRTRRQWTPQEDELVLQGLQLHAAAAHKWILVAQMVPGRTRLQVKSRARRLLPHVYGDKRGRRPSASSMPADKSSWSNSDDDHDQDHNDDRQEEEDGDLEGLHESDDELSEQLSVGGVPERTVSPISLVTVPLSPPQQPANAPEVVAPSRRPRRLSANIKQNPTASLPPLPLSPPSLPTYRPPPSFLPPLPTSLAPLSPPPPQQFPRSTRRRSSTTSNDPRRKRGRDVIPASPDSSLSSAPASPDPGSPAHSPPPTSPPPKHLKPNLLDPFTLLRPLSPLSPPPYTLLLDPAALALLDFHAHLLETEIIGLLGGTFDPLARTLHVHTIYPCDSPAHTTSIQCEMDPVAETRAREAFARGGLSVVGWYHSHPRFDPWPSVRDVENQGVYQRLFATTATPVPLVEQESGQKEELERVVVEPFVGAIITPYHADRPTVVSQIAFYFVGGDEHRSPFQVEPTKIPPPDGQQLVESLGLFDEFRLHHHEELRHLACDYYGWKRYAKLKHSVRSHSGIALDGLVDEFVAKVLSPAALLEDGYPETKDEDDVGQVDV